MGFKKFYLLLFLLFCGYFASAQNKYEREYRIKKSQFPEKALVLIEKKLKDARRIRFYKEIDSIKTSYEVKFKKDRLKYSVEFNEEGILEDVEIGIKSVDIPNDVFSRITQYLNSNFRKHRIRKLQQQYPKGDENAKTTVKDAFQNLMLPYIKYEIIVAGKKSKSYARYEVLFSAEGQFEKIRKSLPSNYDHVLY